MQLPPRKPGPQGKAGPLSGSPSVAPGSRLPAGARPCNCSRLLGSLRSQLMSLHPTGPWAGLHSPGLPAHLQADKGPLSLGSASCPPTASLTSRGPGCQAPLLQQKSPGPWRGVGTQSRVDGSFVLEGGVLGMWKVMRYHDQEHGLWVQAGWVGALPPAPTSCVPLGESCISLVLSFCVLKAE